MVKVAYIFRDKIGIMDRACFKFVMLCVRYKDFV